MREGSGKDWRPIILVGFLLVAAAVVAAILISRGGGGDSGNSVSKTNGCEEVEAPKPKHVSYKAPPQTVKKGEKLDAVLETSCGTFSIALDSTRAPKTVNSFVFLSRSEEHTSELQSQFHLVCRLLL